MGMHLRFIHGLWHARSPTDLIIPGQRNKSNYVLFLQMVQCSEEVDPATIMESGRKRGECQAVLLIDQLADLELDGGGRNVGSVWWHLRAPVTNLP